MAKDFRGINRMIHGVAPERKINPTKLVWYGRTTKELYYGMIAKHGRTNFMGTRVCVGVDSQGKKVYEAK